MQCLPSWTSFKVSAAGQTLVHWIAGRKRENWRELEKMFQQIISNILWLYSINMYVEQT